eukprot:scaffold16070_cov44-Phaeocystis_antarctica.AAC.3
MARSPAARCSMWRRLWRSARPSSSRRSWLGVRVGQTLLVQLLCLEGLLQLPQLRRAGGGVLAGLALHRVALLPPPVLLALVRVLHRLAVRLRHRALCLGRVELRLDPQLQRRRQAHLRGHVALERPHLILHTLPVPALAHGRHRRDHGRGGRHRRREPPREEHRDLRAAAERSRTLRRQPRRVAGAHRQPGRSEQPVGVREDDREERSAHHVFASAVPGNHGVSLFLSRN